MSSSTPPKRRCSTSDVLESEEFRLTAYSDSDRYDHEEIVDHQEHFHRLFNMELPITSKPPFKSTSQDNRYRNKPVSLSLVQVSRMIYAECDNCKDSGWIACNSLLSGLYAKGITECDSILMNLVVCLDIKEAMRNNVVEEIVEGFKSCAKESKTEVTQGQLAVGSRVIIGGVATTICRIKDAMTLDEAAAGDILVLTKPLGTLVSARSYNNEFKGGFDRTKDACFLSNVDEAYETARYCMRRSNKLASILMRKYNARAVIDLNGYSLHESALELARLQKNSVDFKIDMLPLIKHTQEIDKHFNTGLVKGNSPELCGGLLISFSEESSRLFVKEAAKAEGFAFYVGSVIHGRKIATLDEQLQVLPIKIPPNF